MRKLLLLSALLMGSMAVKAQDVIYVCQGNSFSAYPISSLGDITFSGSTVTIASNSATAAGYTYNLADIDSITFTEPVFPQEEEYIHVTFDGSTASVTIPSNITDVTYAVNGAHVTLTSNTTSQEYNYVVDGSSTNGSLTINGSYKFTLTLAGLDLQSTSTTVPPINIQCGKRIAVVLKEGTTNTLVDAANGEQKGAMYFKGHPEFEGGGTLNVTGNTGHAIYAKEYLQLKKTTGTINILGAAKDGIHCGSGDKGDPESYFQMNGGTVNISGCLSDCIDADDYGNAFIKGGTLNLTVPNDGVGLKVDSILTMEDGTINLTAAEDLSTGIRVAYKGYFNGGTVSGTVSGAGTKGINAKKYTNALTKTVLNGGDLFFNGTNVDLTVSGKTYTADSTKCMGIRAEGDLTQTAGTIKLRVTSSDATGLKTEGTETLSGGTLDVTSSSSVHAVSAVNFKMLEGTFTVECTGADSKNLDVDGLMMISGGTVTMSNSGTDAKVMKAWNANLTGGNITLTATGNGGKGLKVDTLLIIGDKTTGTGPVLAVSTTGSATGSSDTQGGGNNPWGGGGGWGRGPGGGGFQPGGQESSSGGSPKAIKCGPSDQKAVGTIYFYGGTTTVSTKNNKGEGIEGKAAIYFHGGDIITNCYDDCVNSGGKIEIDGSRVYCFSNGNDAMDSNYGRTGAITVNSGVLVSISSKGSPEEGIDCDNNNYIVINGGYVFSAGGQQSGGSYNNTGTQNAYWVSNRSVTANQYYSLCNSSNVVQMTLKMPVSINQNYSLISAPGLKSVKYGSSAPTGYTESFNNCVFIGGTTSNTGSWY